MEKNTTGLAMMKKETILSELKDRSSIANAKLPDHVDLEVEHGVLKVHINKPGENMQEDSAAFEAWIVILKYWMGEKIKKVELNWESFDVSDEQRRHYNRFLYRVYIFLKLFPVWFTVATEKVDEISSFSSWLAEEDFVLNEPLNEPKTNESEKENEQHIETLFLNEYSLLKNKLGLTHLYNQLPVGVFRGKVNSYNAIFPGGKGAVDLWGIDESNSILYVFELKFNNKKAGIISELLFYVTLLNEVCCVKNGMFKIDDKGNSNVSRGIHKLTGRKFEALKGYFLVNAIHPLIDNEGIVSLLNEGLSNIGNVELGRLFYEYDNQALKLKNS